MSTLENNMNRSKNDAEKLTNFLYFRDPRGSFTRLNYCLQEFTTRKLSSFVPKILRIVRFQNKIYH